MENEKFKCLVVDDEPIARKIIINYIMQIPFLKVTAECKNAISAIDCLKTHPDINIIFLDINMPNLTGLQLMKIVQPRQPVILTTAYSEYAVESYELNSTDYLLKPFSFERFTKAVYKAVDLITGTNRNSDQIITEKNKKIFIKTEGKNYPVLLDDILYCEAMKNYTKVILNNGVKLMPLIPLSKFETFLSTEGGDFIQIHRSFIVAKKHISNIAANYVTINKLEIPIGVQFKAGFLKIMGMKDIR